MPYEDDEVRRAARERLQARMERRGSADSLSSGSESRRAGRSSSTEYDAGAANAERANRRRLDREQAGAGAGASDAAGAGMGASSSRDYERDAAATRERARNRDRERNYDDGREGGIAGAGAAVSGALGSARERLGGVGEFFATSGDNRTVEVGPVSFDLPFAVPDRIPAIAVPIAALVIVLLLVFAVLIPSCTRSSAPAEGSQSAASASAANASAAAASTSAASANAAATASTTSAAPTTLVLQVAQAKARAYDSMRNASSVPGVDKQESHQAALSELLGDETSAKLLAQAKTSIDALWIAAHPGAYAFDGVEVQYKVLKLAADEPEALTYVREFPDNYPAKEVNMDKSLAMSTSSPAASVPDTSIPHLYQWDRRWGYTTYSSAPFGLTGCGPTSLAMVYQGLTGSVDRTPYDMGKLAEEHGYMDEYEGTVGTFFTEAASELGLDCEELYPSAEGIREALESGKVVIANLAPGYFTATGHYFVLTGLAKDGTAIVNDPYSVARSSQTWDLDTIASQSYICYAYNQTGAAKVNGGTTEAEQEEAAAQQQEQEAAAEV